MKNKTYGNFTVKQIGGFFDRKYKLYDGDILISTSLNSSKQERDKLIELAKQLQGIRLINLEEEKAKGDSNVQN